MEAFDLIAAVKAEIAANRATVRVDGVRVVVANVVDGKMVLTPEGEEMAKTVKPAPKVTPPKTTKAAAKPKSK